MNAQVASYYRSILYADSQALEQLPKSLMKLHAWAEKRNQALGLTTTISKATALAIGLAWLSGTAEGRKFAKENTNLGDMFTDEEDLPAETGKLPDPAREPVKTPISEPVSALEPVSKPEPEPEAGKNFVDWAKIKPGVPVVVTEESGQTIRGAFSARRGVWIDVKVDDVDRHFRLHQVQLAGA